MTECISSLKYPVYRPRLGSREKQYVNACLDSTWISSKGPYIEEFEKKFAEYIDVPFSTTVCNGTVALHLALVAIGIGPGDEVIVPSFTYIASVNAIVHAGAIPVFVDTLASSWQMDPNDIKKKITLRTKAVMAVHLYGGACDMHSIVALCSKHNLLLIEDCAEAFGTLYEGKHVGRFGDIATFSFFGNKTITTGEGGMVVSNHADYHDKAYRLKTQGVSKEMHYWHDLVGYNYRMTNICAAIGLAQLEMADDILEKKRQIAAWYAQEIVDCPLFLHTECPKVKNSFWMYSILLQNPEDREPLRKFLLERGIETRPFFSPAHRLPMYKSNGLLPVADHVSIRGINLPSYPELAKEDVQEIGAALRSYFL